MVCFFAKTMLSLHDPHLFCDKWVVVTTINPPTPALYDLAQLPDWKVVVVGDEKTPGDWYIPGVIFLSIEDQEKLPYKIIKLLPRNHYSRKNIGYLYAIEHNARIIYETDDDNTLLYENIVHLPLYSKCLMYDTNQLTVNPYAYFGQASVWPRGYPLRRIFQSSSSSYVPQHNLFIPIQQGMVNNDPDVDAIFRLTRNEFFDFDYKDPIALPAYTMAPFNSQNTIFFYEAFWGLLIPMATTFRVADIWRGYWVQRLLWDIGSHLVFLPPTAKQERNEHNLMNDFTQEVDLYVKAEALITTLNKWQSSEPNILNRLLDLYQILVKQGFFDQKDLLLAQAWIEDLQNLGYKAPSVIS
jgi:hypothetical protein